jgi:hypothetical protein
MWRDLPKIVRAAYTSAACRDTHFKHEFSPSKEIILVVIKVVIGIMQAAFCRAF